ncbi:MAG: hypothetical protein JWQ90_3958 [Hydrocarboniphaga sp.]|nr:hypothetical protein [Hydrocarboniphaga sp.]
MPSKRVIVVGAGLSGLAAAFTLQQAGFKVLVLERLNRPGGRVQTVRKQAYVIDTGPDAMTLGYREYLSLIDALDLRDRIVLSSPVMGVMRGDSIHDIDPRRPFTAAFTQALSWRGKLGLVAGAMKLRPRLQGIDSFELVESADREDPTSNAWDYSQSLFGAESTAYLIDPAIRLTTGSGARESSMLGVLGALANWTAPMINLKGGLDVLPRAIAERVPIIYGAEVTRVVDTATGATIEYRDAQNLTHTEEGDYCVIGAMYDVGCRIWEPLANLAPDFGPRLKSVKLISVSLGYNALCRSKAYAIAIPSREYPDLLLGFLQHNKAPDRAPPGCSLITFYTDTLAFDVYAEKTDAEIEAWAAGHAETLFPELKGHREICEVTRWPKAGYLATPGFWQRSRGLLRALPDQTRVQLAGDLFGAGSMESAVRWGKRAADRIIANVAQQDAIILGGDAPDL